MSTNHRTAHRTARRTALAAALSLVLVACGGGDGSDTGGLPTADDLGAGEEQPVDPAEESAEGEDAPVTSGQCAPDHPDCQDMVAPGEGDDASGGAAGSCPAGDPDCTDESYGGQDVARPIPLDSSPSTAQRIEPGATSGATGRAVVAVHLLDDTTLEVTFEGGACDLLEDVVVTESATEVRLLVLSGMDADVDVCTMQIVQWSTEVALDEPLGDRTVLDLSG